MISPLFLNINATDILLILIYFLLHLLGLVLFIIALVRKGSVIKKVTFTTLVIQCVFDVIIVVSFFNAFSFVSLGVGIAFTVMVFRIKPKA